MPRLACPKLSTSIALAVSISCLLLAANASAVLVADPVVQTLIQRVQVPDDDSISMICLEFSDGGEQCQNAVSGQTLDFQFDLSECGTTWNAYAYNSAGIKSEPSDTGVNFTIDADCDGFVQTSADLFCIYRMLFKDDFSCVKSQ